VVTLRRGAVVATDPLEVEVGGERRRAWADPVLVGEVGIGDEVVVNTEALDLGLGSGGYDIVHVNLSRGIGGGGAGEAHVMKLNYTSLQHPVEPVEPSPEEGRARPARGAVLVLPLHGHLAPAAWAARETDPNVRVGFVQTAGGALPGRLSRDVVDLRERGLLAGHITVAPCYGGEHEAMSLVGGLHAALTRLDWGAAFAGPGPGILGSATRYGHGGMAALDTAHAALALGLPTLISPRLSSSDPRPRHRGLSHHSAAVLELLISTVRVAVPEVDAERWADSAERPEADALDELIELCRDRHDIDVQRVDLDRYADSGLPTRTMGRELTEDPLFFAAPLAAGQALVASAARAAASAANLPGGSA
jgi:Protein of unknown function (DUF3866)